MKINIVKKLESVGGIEKNIFCTDDPQLIENAFINIETLFNTNLPSSYKDLCKSIGAFSFNEPMSVKCIDSDPIMLPGNKLTVGDFYCITECKGTSVGDVLSTYQEQLVKGLLPICDGELGDLICMSLRKEDFEYIYYFDHEGLSNRALFLVAKSFEDFITKLEVYKGTASDSEIIKNMKVEMTPEFLALLKRDGYGPKE